MAEEELTAGQRMLGEIVSSGILKDSPRAYAELMVALNGSMRMYAKPNSYRPAVETEIIQIIDAALSLAMKELPETE